MMLYLRFKRLLTPNSILHLSMIIAGVIIGFQYGLNKLYWQVALKYQIPLEEWGRFMNAVWGIMRAVLGITLFCYAVSVVFAPEESDRALVRRIARWKLAQPYLTETEIASWTKVLEDMKDGR